MVSWFPQINTDKCTGSGVCVAGCPTGALAIIADKTVVANPALCNYCAVCEDRCPTSAVELPYLVSFKSSDTSNTEKKTL
jgi:NAD-dependent dihydropyrimidine dehydrogenase PreA subunit